MTDRLNANQALTTNGSLTNPQGYKLILQADGNLVLYNRSGHAVWDLGSTGRGAVKALMQTDGNFVLYNRQNKSVWDLHTQGHPGSYLLLQSDGNIVIYQGRSVVWQSDTMGGVKHEHKTGLAAFADSLGQGVQAVGKLSKDVVNSPVWKVAAGVAVVIPGIGIPLSAGMVGAAAIGKAHSAKDAIVGAAREALPGGDIAKLGFDAGVGIAVDGKGIDATGLGIIRGQLPPVAQASFDTALTLHVGRLQGQQAPAQLPFASRAAFYTSIGAKAAALPPATQKAVLTNVAASPAARAGLIAAADELERVSAQEMFAKVSELVRKINAKDPVAVKTWIEINIRAKKGDEKARKLSDLIAQMRGAKPTVASKTNWLAWLKNLWTDVEKIPHRLSASLSTHTPKTIITVKP